MMGYTDATYTRGVDASHNILIQSKKEVDGEIITDVLDELVFDSSDPQTEIGVVETRPIRVRGQETNLIISDLENSEGLVYRQALATFQGNGGPVMFLSSESVENWDTAIVEALLTSIH